MKKQAKKQELTVIDTNVNSPAELIRAAVAGKADLQQLKELLAIQRDYEANEARKAYHKAMAAFKANPPKIEKDRQVAYGNTKYSHASLANVTEKISVELSKYGLSASWTTKTNGVVSVTCKITHELGHSEETTLSAASDTSGSKNAIQAIGSTITYLERYTLLALTGLATYDQDDDGQAAGAPIVNKPASLSEKLVTKGLSEKTKANLAKAQKLLGSEKFFEILGKEGYEKVEQINNETVATQIIRDMGEYYETHKA
jgi:hypothetical protein